MNKILLFCCLFATPLIAQNISDGVILNTNANIEKPHWLRDVSVQFPAYTNLDNVWNMRAILVVGKHTFGTATPARTITFAGKMVDSKTRKFGFQVGGLSADTEYTLHLLIDTPQCGADAPISTTFRTDKAPQYELIKALVIVDDELRNEPAITKALDQYIQDARYTQKPVEASIYWIANTLQEKKKLSDYLKANALSNNIQYLFFVGTNALMPLRQQTVSPIDNVVKVEGTSDGFSVYTNLLNNEFEWKEGQQSYSAVNYQANGSVCTAGAVDLRNRVVESRYADLSFGALIPTQKNTDAKKNLVLNYLDKLHQFKTGKLSFDKKTLFSDANNGDDYLKIELSNLDRWKSGYQFVRWGHTPSPAYNANDIIWKDDYLSKLGNESYEMCMLNVHGSPTTHLFGISSGEIQSMPRLNTLFLNFFSCSVGNFAVNNYLAGTYLEAGNTLFVNAFGTEIFVSNFKNTFSPTQTYGLIARGDCISDAIRNTYGYLGSQILLGDPLLGLDSKVSITATEPTVAEVLSVYPNPVVNQTFTVRSDKEVSLQLIDLQGKILLESKLEKNQETPFILNQIPTETLLLKASDATGQYWVKKLIVK